MQQPSETLKMQEDICLEGARLAHAFQVSGQLARLLGGVAVWIRCPSAREEPLKRLYGDLDLAALSSSRAALTRFLEDYGYTPDKRFNALHGASRLMFVDEKRQRRIDVILDRFAMCHSIDLHGRLAGQESTLPLVDLLLTKLQVFQLNEKDLLDILALLADHPLGKGANEIDTGRVEMVTRGDWGLEHTIRRTLETAHGRANWPGLPPATIHSIRERIDGIVSVLDASSKTARWKMRDRIGERVRWYELPEEVH